MSKIRETILVLTGLRKFFIMTTLILVGIGFRVSDLLNGEEFVDLLEGTAIAYFAANSGEHMTKAIIEWAKGKLGSNENS